MRSHDKTTTLIESAINEIIANKDNISNSMIRDICKKYDVIEHSVRVIGGWNK